MNEYERQCRWLLRAFPPEFRHERGENLIATLLDDAPSGSRRVGVGTAADLVVSGARMRAVRAGAAISLRRSASEGMGWAALIGLGVQAALAVASAVYEGEHGWVFYLPVGGPAPDVPGRLGAQFLLTWIVLAAAGVTAFAAAVRSAWRTAAALSVLANGYLLTSAVVAVALTDEGPTQLRIRGSSRVVFPGPWLSRYMEFSSTPGLLAIGVIAACLAVTMALRAGRRRDRPHSWWWLVAGAGLAVVFGLAGDGSAAQGSVRDLRAVYPPQGGIMTVFQILVVSGMGIALLWSVVDPRAGWAVAVLAVPFVIQQVSDLTLDNYYYGYLHQSGWLTALPLILGAAGITALIASAALTTRRLRRC